MSGILSIKTAKVWYNKAMEEIKPEKTYHDDNWKFKKGNPGGGRPKDSISVISRLKREFRENPEMFDEFIKSYRENPQNQKHIAEMIDGKPRQNIGLDGGEAGLAIQFANSFNKDAD